MLGRYVWVALNPAFSPLRKLENIDILLATTQSLLDNWYLTASLLSFVKSLFHLYTPEQQQREVFEPQLERVRARGLPRAGQVYPGQQGPHRP